ncbi:MAG: hypothetical protein H6704_06285 [Myxococcales bacterium]|nr:hypothetical protein [Myxococcales bacterium]
MARWALWMVGLVAGCGGRATVNGVRPGPVGEPAVLLWVDDAGAVPVACYDPLWVELRGASDCADIVPPGVTVRGVAGGEAAVVDRGPAGCGGVRLALDGAVAGWAVWPPTVQATVAGDALQADLDADGTPETARPWVCAE